MKIAINGFGRIGRTFFRQAFGHPEIDIVAINDLGEIENLAYLLRYDTVYRTYEKSVEVSDGKLVIDGAEVAVLQERDPAKLPWGELDVDIVVESTGIFTTYEKSKAHLDAGAKRVVITAPADDTVPHVLAGGNEFSKDLARITSDASCTTNAAVPLVSIFELDPGIEKALLNTVHGYTASQSLVDGPAKKDARRGRAAAQNIVPSSTGAAEAVILSQPWLREIFDGIALRVPVVTGSIIDLTFVSKKVTSVQEINNIMRRAAQDKRWQGIFTASEEPLVSSDIIGNTHASIADLSLTRVVGGSLVKVMAWYDNEWGYAATLLRHVLALKSLL